MQTITTTQTQSFSTPAKTKRTQLITFKICADYWAKRGREALNPFDKEAYKAAIRKRDYYDLKIEALEYPQA